MENRTGLCQISESRPKFFESIVSDVWTEVYIIWIDTVHR